VVQVQAVVRVALAAWVVVLVGQATAAVLALAATVTTDSSVTDLSQPNMAASVEAAIFFANLIN
jgi:sarcosine oxidase gamma subunit